MRLKSYFILVPLAGILALGSTVEGLSAQSATSGDATCWVRGERADLPNRASPFDSASAAVDEGRVKVCYSRPRMLGRTIMGELVPFGEPWRLGANEATAIHVSFPATIAGVSVDPGWYSLYAIPGESEWTIVVNESVERWGIPINAALRERDVGTGTVQVETVPGPVEMLTATLVPGTGSDIYLQFDWDQTRVSIPIQAVGSSEG